MNKILKIGYILIIMISVVTASVYAAHIPPLWIPFTVSVIVMSGALYALRRTFRTELQQSQNERHPLKIFSNMLDQALSVCKSLLKKSDYDHDDVAQLEDLTEYLTTRMDRIHPQLTEVLGMKQFIDLILPYARAERLANRALSAMMDGYHAEANQSLQESVPFWEETIRILEKIGKIKN